MTPCGNRCVVTELCDVRLFVMPTDSVLVQHEENASSGLAGTNDFGASEYSQTSLLITFHVDVFAGIFLMNKPRMKVAYTDMRTGR